MKICNKCKKNKQAYPNVNNNNWCRECNNKYHREYDRKTGITKKYKWLLRKKALLMIGNSCINCGETDIRILQINHKDGGGGKEYGKGKHSLMYRKLISGERKTNDLDVRCANCNILYEYERGARRAWKLPRDLQKKLYKV